LGQKTPYAETGIYAVASRIVRRPMFRNTEYVLQRISLLGSRVNGASLTCAQAGGLRTHTAVIIQHWVQ
jgi:hypothetical protein